MQEVFSEMDESGNGKIDFQEFVEACQEFLDECDPNESRLVYDYFLRMQSEFDQQSALSSPRKQKKNSKDKDLNEMQLNFFFMKFRDYANSSNDTNVVFEHVWDKVLNAATKAGVE